MVAFSVLRFIDSLESVILSKIRICKYDDIVLLFGEKQRGSSVGSDYQDSTVFR